jgi:hypothetical protein
MVEEKRLENFPALPILFYSWPCHRVATLSKEPPSCGIRGACQRPALFDHCSYSERRTGHAEMVFYIGQNQLSVVSLDGRRQGVGIAKTLIKITTVPISVFQKIGRPAQ